MKLLVLDQFSDLGGAQRMLLDLLPAMRARGWSALLALPGKGPLGEQARALGCEVAQIDCGPFASTRKSISDLLRFAFGTPRLIGQIRGLAWRFEPDVIYINGPRLLPAAGWAGLRNPVVFHAHSAIAQGFVQSLAGCSLEHLHARVIAVSQSVAEGWRPFGAATVIYNGVAGPTRGGVRGGSGALRIGCVGRIAPEKGQREFLQAAAEISRAFPQARFVICGAPLFGDRRSRSYEAAVREAAQGLPVEFSGWVPDVYPILQSLDLLLAPSVWEEPSPRVVLEAFAAVLPVIAFRTGGLPEIIDHGRTGLLCNSAGEMARLAVDLICGGGLQHLGEAAREEWRRRFQLERWQHEVLAEIERVASGAVQPARV